MNATFEKKIGQLVTVDSGQVAHHAYLLGSATREVAESRHFSVDWPQADGMVRELRTDSGARRGQRFGTAGWGAASRKGGRMRHLVGSIVALAIVAAGPAAADDLQFKPIDTNKLVVKPSKTAANLTAATIKMVGNTTAGAVESNGYVKTINNLLGFRRPAPAMPVQPGRSSLPAPGLFTSTQYKSFNTPVMPSSQPTRR